MMLRMENNNLDKKKTFQEAVKIIGFQDLSVVAKTLIIPLYFRALESQRPDGVIRDQKAVELCKQLGYSFDEIESRSIDHVAAVLRTHEFDYQARAFLREHPDAVVVHIGCGFDTRFDRVDNGQVEWYDLDLPEVIALRSQFIPDTPRSHNLAYSVFDTAWMDCIGKSDFRSLLVLADGVLPFFGEKDVRRIMVTLTNCFPGVELAFDTISPFLVRIHNLRVRLTGIGASVHWGLKHGQELETWQPSLKLISEHFYLEQADPCLWWSRMMRYVPLVSRGVRILRYRHRH